MWSWTTNSPSSPFENEAKKDGYTGYHWVPDFDLTNFYFQSLKNTVPLLWYIIPMKNLLSLKGNFSLAAFKSFPFSSYFINLISMCLGMDLSDFILLTIYSMS